MSWDADLIPGTIGDPLAVVRALGSWNYTHNTNPMIDAARLAIGDPDAGARWWEPLYRADGPDGARYLHGIIVELSRAPEVYDRLNPSNGWGSRESLVAVLTDMRNSVPERPCRWWIGG